MITATEANAIKKINDINLFDTENQIVRAAKMGQKRILCIRKPQPILDLLEKSGYTISTNKAGVISISWEIAD